MKTVHNFDEALRYVHRLGFAPNSNIIHQQGALCAVVEALEAAAGGYPFKVVNHRYKSPEGHSYPWLSEFIVHGAKGKQRVLPCKL
ncbi:MAG: hypothetical protein HPY52_17045 [Firmicutes bacterium]|nr:hypothetical protein [Bacillota bacterium]